MLRRLLPLLAVCALSATTGCDSLAGDNSFALGTPEEADNGDWLEDEEDTFQPTHLLQCEQLIPCDAMQLTNPEVSLEFDDSEARYTETERCVLETLASGSPALVQTVADFDESTAYLDFALAGDGVVLRQAHGEGERITAWSNTPSDCQLRAPAYFADCLEMFHASCLIPDNWVEGCVDLGGLVCPEQTSAE